MAATLVIGGDPVIEARVRRLTRARRLSLRVSRLDGRVTLSMPRSMPLREAETFLHERAGWLRAALAEQPAQVAVTVGSTVPVGDRLYAVTVAPHGTARQEADAVLVRGARPIGAQVAALLRRRARGLLEPACAGYGVRVGRRVGRITLRDTRSRWGSCTAAGNLMFSWRLAMAPEAVLDYVAAHEVAHLREMNHGPRFWALVREICPEFETHRKWLHVHGADLHRYRFEPEEP